ncbi:MAG: tetratricopeptide repeat protein [Desulfuromusa sp.]|jgi:Tfp pilus assembly protein PilF|nr:tetratricopeptide repeat protein [Desulfuromusa sp.]
MLESGYTVFDCQIVKPLSENKVYQSYLVRCPDSRDAKLFVLFPDPLLDPQQQKTSIDRANWLASQTIPGIGSPLQAGLLDGQLAYLYPHPHGESLLSADGDSFTVAQSVDLIQKIATSLSAAHSAGVWHGSLSPDNIFTEADSPYLADFSLSQLIRLDFHSGIDPRYTSPEQVRGETPEAAADIYSLGCIFYHLLTGTPPFSADEPFAIAKQHLQDEFPALPEELEVLQPLLASMTAAVVAERASADELVDHINRLSKSHELEQISFQRTTEPQEADDSEPVKNSSLLDEALTGSEIAARIEERLKEHASHFKDPEVFETQLERDNIDVVADLDQVKENNKIGFGRVILILLLGIVIGSGLYFLFANQYTNVTPDAGESKVVPEAIPLVDLDHGLQLWRGDDFNGAEAEFKQIIANHQKDPRAYNNLAAFYAAQGNYEQARDYLEQALATDEKYATIYRNLGSVYAEMARGSYGRALQLDRAKETVYLPVFSNQGIVKLKSVADVATTTVVAAAEKATETTTLSEAGKIISAAENNKTEEAKEISEVNSVAKEPLAAVATEEGSQPPKVEVAVIAAKQEVTVKEEQNNDAEPDLQTEDIKSFMQRWAQAWSNQDVDAYLSFYGEQFVPAAGRSRADWEALRRSRLLAPKEIQVKLDDFQINPLENGRQRVEVIQSYTSNLLSDRFKKSFDLQQTETGWEILQERSLGRVR